MLIAIVSILSILLLISLVFNWLQANKSKSMLESLELKLVDKLQQFELNQTTALTSLSTKQETLLNQNEKSEKSVREEMARNRDELSNNLKNSSDVLSTHVRDLSKLQSDQLNQFADRLKVFGDTTNNQLKSLQEDNNKKLDQMRNTVDEKLQSTLETRIAASFKQVSERLEMVHKGLGEMQSLASGVGDLKKVLTNVKTRGTWGEIQLSSLLEQVLSPEQYQANVATKPNTQERVDYAIKLPGDSDSEGSEPVWLPIDAKFPQEDYQRLIEAQEAANVELAEQAIKQLETRIKLEAKSIRDKYIEPPYTTDFALMFLPTEGLYAEVIRRPGLLEKLQRECRVNVVGPTTLAALLNSLQMGFRTLTIQKRSSEVWKLLADIKKHFGSFGDLLAKAHDKVEQASKVIEDAGRRSRTIESKLKKVGELPDSTTNTDKEDLISQAGLN